MSTTSSAQAATRTISPERLYEMVRGGQTVDLIDVRTPAEFRAEHASVARSVPIDTLDPGAVMAARGETGEPLYVICKSGGRSARACASFAAAGFGDRVVDVLGGTSAWTVAGLPVVKGRSVWSLDRQVQFTAGSLILLGCVLGAFVSPWFYLLAAWCGLGLCFAGLSGTCLLGSLMARMPWNQAGTGADTAAPSPSCCR